MAQGTGTRTENGATYPRAATTACSTLTKRITPRRCNLEKAKRAFTIYSMPTLPARTEYGSTCHRPRMARIEPGTPCLPTRKNPSHRASNSRTVPNGQNLVGEPHTTELASNCGQLNGNHHSQQMERWWIWKWNPPMAPTALACCCHDPPIFGILAGDATHEWVRWWIIAEARNTAMAPEGKQETRDHLIDMLPPRAHGRTVM